MNSQGSQSISLWSLAQLQTEEQIQWQLLGLFHQAVSVFYQKPENPTWKTVSLCLYKIENLTSLKCICKFYIMYKFCEAKLVADSSVSWANLSSIAFLLLKAAVKSLFFIQLDRAPCCTCKFQNWSVIEGNIYSKGNMGTKYMIFTN